MEFPAAVEALSALAHASRLAIFRLLVRTGPEGIAAGAIGREVGCLPSTLSSHLAILGHAGLVRSRREGRSIIYAADFEGTRALFGFLIDDCCSGRPELCAPLTEAAACGPAPQGGCA
jgi:DNA-binding transcriptional ArsR family regulator